MHNINTLGDLKKSGYVSKSIKQELRDNLIKKIQKKEKVFEGILGFDDTVLPDIERAILSRHNIYYLVFAVRPKQGLQDYSSHYLMNTCLSSVDLS